MKQKYHEGERYLQEKFGENSIAKRTSRIIRSEVIEGAIPFLENQAYIIASSRDAKGNIWSSMLIGATGWINASTKGEVTFSLDKLLSPKTDMFFENIKTHSKIGTIFIELGTRRRYRINGTVSKNDTTLILTIEEAYPNCPKYISRRVLTSLSQNPSLVPTITEGTALTNSQRDFVTAADTFFVSSISANGTMDASHRGGNAGFIELLENSTLKIPDYIGNSMFNTMGNMCENPKSGLLFIDFDTGTVLQLTGTTSFVFDQDSKEDQHKTTGTGRYWLFKIDAWVQTTAHHTILWEYIDASPYNVF